MEANSDERYAKNDTGKLPVSFWFGTNSVTIQTDRLQDRFDGLDEPRENLVRIGLRVGSTIL